MAEERQDEDAAEDAVLETEGTPKKADPDDEDIETVIPEIVKPQQKRNPKNKGKGSGNYEHKAFKYDPKFCKMLVEFFTVKEPYKLISITKSYYKDGELKTDHQERVPVPPPFFEGFARKIGVTMKTLREWDAKYPEFALARQQAGELLKELVISNGLVGLYDSKFTQFASKNMEEIAWKDEVTTNIKIDGKSINDAWIKRQKALKDEAKKELPPGSGTPESK